MWFLELSKSMPPQELKEYMTNVLCPLVNSLMTKGYMPLSNG
jgi:hypothetical protein